MTERDAITFLEQHGYKVMRQRVTRPRSQKRLLGAHLQGEHRGAYEDSCRACRFGRTIVMHRTHTDAPDCALCIDQRTVYLFPSRPTFAVARAA